MLINEKYLIRVMAKKLGNDQGLVQIQYSTMYKA